MSARTLVAGLGLASLVSACSTDRPVGSIPEGWKILCPGSMPPGGGTLDSACAANEREIACEDGMPVLPGDAAPVIVDAADLACARMRPLSSVEELLVATEPFLATRATEDELEDCACQSQGRGEYVGLAQLSAGLQTDGLSTKVCIRDDGRTRGRIEWVEPRFVAARWNIENGEPSTSVTPILPVAPRFEALRVDITFLPGSATTELTALEAICERPCLDLVCEVSSVPGRTGDSEEYAVDGPACEAEEILSGMAVCDGLPDCQPTHVYLQHEMLTKLGLALVQVAADGDAVLMPALACD